MTATTTARDANRSEGRLVANEIAASTTLYKGTLLCENTAGYIVNGVDTASYKFAGVSTESQNNSAGDAGDLKVVIDTDGVFIFKFNGTPAITDMWDTAYILDNQTVGNTSTNGIKCGRIVGVPTSSTSMDSPTNLASDEVRVKIDVLRGS